MIVVAVEFFTIFLRRKKNQVEFTVDDAFYRLEWRAAEITAVDISE